MSLRILALVATLLFFYQPAYPAFRMHSAAKTAICSHMPDDGKQEQTKKKARGGQAGFAIASFCCAIAGLAFAAIVCGIAAIILGFVGLSNKRKLQGLSIAGVVLGFIDFLAGLIVATKK